ncbi:hypothetical protein BDN72DRAFT_903909 [Pluteus cervinus]|uniref:Uncharacterized protein n=1 Tax=Pluteus cervinus TaxID=181527 RepID=A0ACD3A8E4_9AGAR|nr:hypothetical protein BDN72DRAFT_903909 [Pluteus cervinus]
MPSSAKTRIARPRPPFDDPDLAGQTLNRQITINDARLRELLVEIVPKPICRDVSICARSHHNVNADFQIGLHTRNLGQWFLWCSTCNGGRGRANYVTPVVDPDDHPGRRGDDLHRWAVTSDILERQKKGLVKTYSMDGAVIKPVKKPGSRKVGRLSAAASFRPIELSPPPWPLPPMGPQSPSPPPPYFSQTKSFSSTGSSSSALSFPSASSSTSSSSAPLPVVKNDLTLVLWDGDKRYRSAVTCRDDNKFYLFEWKVVCEAINFDLGKSIDIYVRATQQWHPWNYMHGIFVATGERSIHFKYSNKDASPRFSRCLNWDLYPDGILGAVLSGSEDSPSPPSSPLAGKGAVAIRDPPPLLLAPFPFDPSDFRPAHLNKSTAASLTTHPFDDTEITIPRGQKLQKTPPPSPSKPSEVIASRSGSEIAAPPRKKIKKESFRADAEYIIISDTERD